MGGAQRTMQDTFATLLKLIYITLHTQDTTLHTPSAPQFASCDTNSHETRTTYMTSQRHK